MERDWGTDEAQVAAVRRALLAHFDAHARPLPWRGVTDPYAIWVSEVMLQQTRVDAAVPYYERWLARFPDVHTLADAPVDDVLKAWEGLGYYSRARNLHRAARLVRERYRGALPEDYASLRALPGVGDYTAGAVASIAFGRRQPAVDGNARRVLARLLDEADPPPARLRERAAALVDHERPGDVNQAIMELGATVCTPRTPHCDACPIRTYCAAAAAGTQLERPAPKRAATPPLYVKATAVIVEPGGRALLVRRAGTGLLAGMWTFPAREVRDVAGAARGARAECRARLGDLPIAAARRIGVVDHAFSHRRERYVCIRIELADAPDVATGPDAAWVGADVAAYPLPRAQQRIHALLHTPDARRAPRNSARESE